MKKAKGGGDVREIRTVYQNILGWSPREAPGEEQWCMQSQVHAPLIEEHHVYLLLALSCQVTVARHSGKQPVTTSYDAAPPP